MERKLTILLGILLVLAAVAVPLGGTLYYSWIDAKETEIDTLYSIAQRIVKKARITLNESYTTLRYLNDNDSTYTPCSLKHQNALDTAIFNFIDLKEIEYINNNQVLCNSRGAVTKQHTHTPEKDLLSNGISVGFENIPYQNTFGNKFVSFQLGNYNAIFNTASFSNVFITSYLQAAIITPHGHIISSVNDLTQDDITLILKESNKHIVNDNLVAVVKTPDFTVIVTEPLNYIKSGLYRNIKIFLPFGLLMSFFLGAAIVWATMRQLSLRGEIKLGLSRNEFIPYYQPIMDINTGHCIGAEALLRWRRASGKIIPPDVFIPLAEESGLIELLTDSVIKNVVHDLNKVLTQNRALHVSINIPTSDFISGRVLTVTEEYLSSKTIERHQIWLEITERAMMDVKASLTTTQKARELGYAIVIDDFGTGYSSLSYLQRFPIDILKIDKSFIASLETDSVTSHVTKHIIDIAKTLHLKIVAEGIETTQQLAYLHNHKVEYGQGWLYAKPMPIKEFLAFLKQNAQKETP